MNEYPDKPIHQWAIEERPREKLLSRGLAALTDIELLAILLSTGTKENSALGLARLVLEKTGGIDRLASADLHDLLKVRGIGKAKALKLIAAFELNRRKTVFTQKPAKIRRGDDAARYLKPRMEDLSREVFYVLFLNRNNEIIAEKELFSGGVSSTIADPKIIFREALGYLACAIIVCHNHPSGSLEPSVHDIDLTRKLWKAGKFLDVDVLDHIIISRRGHYSFADNGHMEP